MKAKVYITPKKSVLDPQGKAVQGALDSLGYEGIEDVRLGRFMEITLKGMSEPMARKTLEEMCKRLLANPVIEDFRFELEGVRRKTK